MGLRQDRRQRQARDHAGQKGTSPEVDRYKGFMEGLKKCPDMKVVAQQWTERWAADGGNKIGQDTPAQPRSPSITFGQADAIALGASQADQAVPARPQDLDHRL